MFRRDFLALTASTVPGAIGAPPTVQRALDDLERAIKAEMPFIAKVRIYFDPSEPKVPLMVHAFRG